jgi:hypothetical protein
MQELRRVPVRPFESPTYTQLIEPEWDHQSGVPEERRTTRLLSWMTAGRWQKKPRRSGALEVEGFKDPTWGFSHRTVSAFGPATAPLFRIGTGSADAKSPGSRPGRGGKRPHDVASLREAKPASPLNVATSRKARRAIASALPARCRHSAADQPPFRRRVGKRQAGACEEAATMTDLLPQQRRELFRPGREAFVLVREPQHLLPGQLVVHLVPYGAHLLGSGTPILLVVVGLHT